MTGGGGGGAEGPFASARQKERRKVICLRVHKSICQYYSSLTNEGTYLIIFHAVVFAGAVRTKRICTKRGAQLQQARHTWHTSCLARVHNAPFGTIQTGSQQLGNISVPVKFGLV